MNFNEKDIIKRLRDGDIQAMRPLMAMYRNYVFTLTLRIVKKKELAEEATQDVFVKVFRKIKSFDGRSKFRSWLYAVAYRTALNYLDKKELKAADRLLRPEDIYEIPGFIPSDEMIFRQDMKSILWDAINRLPQIQALCITLFYLQELPVNEVAEVLKVPSNTVKTNLFRGRKTLFYLLQNMLKKEELL